MTATITYTDTTFRDPQLADLLERGGESAERVRLHYLHFREIDLSEAAWERYCLSNPKNTRAENWRRRRDNY